MKITRDFMDRAIFKAYHHLDVNAFPGYKEKIDRPIDLETIRRKLDNNSYATPADWLEEMQLVFQNAVDYWKDENPLWAYIGQYGLGELDRFAAGLDVTTDKEWMAQVDRVTKKLAKDIARKPSGSQTTRTAEEVTRKAQDVPELSSYDIVNLVNRLNAIQDDEKREVVIEILRQMEGITIDANTEKTFDAEALNSMTIRALKAFVDKLD